MTIRALAIVFTFVLLLLVPPHTIQAETHQTVPSANFSFMSDLQNFLRVEDANRYSDFYSSAVISGGIHSTAAGLVGSPTPMVAYVGGFYITESGTITYPDASTCHVIAHKDITADQGSYNRVAGTHYLINCASASPPAIPNVNSVLLMTVTTSGGAITAVVDKRPLGPHLGFDACRYATLDDAITALGTSPVPLLVSCVMRSTINLTVPTTTILRVSNAGQLCPDVGTTLTINATFDAPGRPVFCSTGGTVTFGNNTNSIVRSSWFQPTTAGFQAALDSLGTGQTFLCDKSVTGTGWTITNKSHITIIGKCTLTLSSAISAAMIFDLVGTIDDLEIAGITFVGENNATYGQSAIGNYSGQAISNVRTHDLTISDINVGISYNAALSGSFVGGSIYRNKISNIIGTSTGQGYGIHLANATGITVEMNEIDNAQRHSIYHAWGDNTGARIVSNHITNHRSSVANQTVTCAIVISRSSGVLLANNIIEGAYDCQLEISHVTVDNRNASDISIVNNQFLDRKNLVYGVIVGEQSVPAGNSTSHIIFDGNLFKSSYTNITGNGDVIILNGTDITYRNNTHYITDITSTARFISLGHNSYISAAADCTNTNFIGNSFFASGSSLTDVRGVEVESDITTGTSTHEILNNFGPQVVSMMYPTATPTNARLIYNRSVGGLRVGVYTAADLTPSVYHVDVLVIANASAKTITTLDDGEEGQTVKLIFSDGNTTIADGATVQLSGGSNFVSSGNDSLTLTYSGGVWLENGRSVN